MGIKVSVQVGSSVSLGHNRRVKSMCAKDGHIDWERTQNNEILIDKNVRNEYRRLFGDAVDEYNENQKDERRKIKDYYNKIKEDKQKHNLYEIIVQVGSVDDPVEPQTAKKILEDYYYKFIGENKNLAVTGAYIHTDEATPHMHIDFIPIAEFSRGLRKRNALNKAFEEMMGEKSKSPKNTAQIEWQARQREILRDISASHGIETDEVEHGKRIKHLDTPQYKEVMERAGKDLEAIRRKQNDLLEKIEAKLAYLDKKIPLNYQDGITQNDWSNLHAQKPQNDHLYGVGFEYVKVPTAIAKNISKYAIAENITTQAFRAFEELKELKKELSEIMGSKPVESELHEINQAKLKLEKSFKELERKNKLMEEYLEETGQMKGFHDYLEIGVPKSGRSEEVREKAKTPERSSKAKGIPKPNQRRGR